MLSHRFLGHSATDCGVVRGCNQHCEVDLRSSSRSAAHIPTGRKRVPRGELHNRWFSPAALENSCDFTALGGRAYKHADRLGWSGHGADDRRLARKLVRRRRCLLALAPKGVGARRAWSFRAVLSSALMHHSPALALPGRTAADASLRCCSGLCGSCSRRRSRNVRLAGATLQAHRSDDTVLPLSCTGKSAYSATSVVSLRQTLMTRLACPQLVPAPTREAMECGEMSIESRQV